MFILISFLFEQVIWKRLHNTSSGIDCGTLYHLRNYIQRRNIRKQIQSDPTACEDFFQQVEAYVTTAALNALDMHSTEDTTINYQGNNWADLDTSGKLKFFNSMVSNIVTQLVNLHWPENSTDHEKYKSDQLFSYASEVMSLGMFYNEYCDAIHEGDGQRILCCWRYMLLLFKASNRTKYTIKAFTLLA